jgi:hypothetical protein
LLAKQLTEEEVKDLDAIVDKYQSRSQVFDSTGSTKKEEKQDAPNPK